MTKSTIQKQHQAHDRYVHFLMSNKAIYVAFFKAFLPYELQDIVDLSELRMEQEVLTNINKKRHILDMVFSAPIRGEGDEQTRLFITFEHKSSASDV